MYATAICRPTIADRIKSILYLLSHEPVASAPLLHCSFPVLCDHDVRCARDVLPIVYDLYEQRCTVRLLEADYCIASIPWTGRLGPRVRTHEPVHITKCSCWHRP